MHLDELKNLWQQQEQALQASNRTNEQILRNMLEQRSTSAIGQLLNVEYLSLAVVALTLTVALCSMSFFTGSGLLVAALVVSLILLGGALGWGVYKIRLLHRLDFGGAAVAHVAEELERFRLLILREKLVSLLLAPLLMAALMALAHALVRRDDITPYLSTYAVRLVIGYAVVVLFTVLWYRRYYFRNIEAATRHLQEIKAFRQS